MRDENAKKLEKLSKTCYNAGLLPIFLGILIMFIDIINWDPMHLFVGIFVFMSGYSFIKISAKLSLILKDEGV